MSNQTETPESKLLGLLLKEMKLSSKAPEVRTAHWVEKHFGIPSRPEDVLWRMVWLAAIPAIATILYMHISSWLWSIGQVTLLTVSTLAIAFIILGFAYAAIAGADHRTKSLVGVQLFFAWFIVLCTMVWQGAAPYVQQ